MCCLLSLRFLLKERYFIYYFVYYCIIYFRKSQISGNLTVLKAVHALHIIESPIKYEFVKKKKREPLSL